MLLSTWVDADRASDKTELSNTLSAYANSLCASVSAQVEQNRTDDKAELSNVLSSYANSLSNSISTTVENAGFAIVNDTDLSYDPNNHKISLVLKDYLGAAKTMTIDTTDFIKNRIVHHVKVIGDNLQIWWTADDGSTSGIYTEIPISALAQIYHGSDGINITPDLSIVANSTIARTTAVNGVAETVNNLSTTIVPALRTDVNNI